MKTLFFICLLFWTSFVCAQNSTETFQENNFEWKQNTSGLLFYDVGNSMPGMEIPAGEGNSPVFSSAFWAGGLTPDGDVRVATQYFCQDQSGDNCIEKWGPLKIGSAETTLEVADAYNRFWFVTRQQIDAQIAYFGCQSDPNCDTEILFPNGYTIPESILTWPASGPDEPGYADHLAPFVDYNGDGDYTPEMGDYPNICGDFSTYLITNDVGTTNTNAPFESLGIEIHTRVYGYYESSGALFNTLFVQHEVINRSAITYSDMYLGTFTDFDLGNPMDDYIGTDVQRSMYFAKNGDGFDESSVNGPGYGDDLPMMGVRYLAGPYMDANGTDDAPISDQYERYGNQTSGWGDGIIDNERFGLRSAFAFQNGPPAGQPMEPTGKYFALQGIWKDGTSMTYGNFGYNPDSEVTTTYQFPGLSDPLLAGTNGINPQDTSQTGWTENSAGDAPGDRRMIAASGAFTFAPGDVQYLDYAFIFARQSMDPEIDLRQILNNYADDIIGKECGALPDIVSGVSEKEKAQFEFDIYPNPTTESITVQLGLLNNGKYEIYDPLGRKVSDGFLNETRTSIPISELKPGVYIIKIYSSGAFGSRKFIVE